MDCCDTIIGGLVQIEQGDRTYEVTGDVTILPAPVERTNQASASGRLYSTVRAKLVTANVSFANYCDRDPVKLFLEADCPLNMTVTELSRGFRHLMTKAMLGGTPEVNLATGEVTGIVIECDFRNYTKVTADGSIAA